MYSAPKTTKVLNGFNVVAHEWLSGQGAYIILGERTTDAGHEYVTGYVRNMELDREWYWGNYYHSDFTSAVENYQTRGR